MWKWKRVCIFYSNYFKSKVEGNSKLHLRSYMMMICCHIFKSDAMRFQWNITILARLRQIFSSIHETYIFSFPIRHWISRLFIIAKGPISSTGWKHCSNTRLQDSYMTYLAMHSRSMRWAPDLNSTLHTAAKNCTLKYPMNIHLVGEISISCFEKNNTKVF